MLRCILSSTQRKVGCIVSRNIIPNEYVEELKKHRYVQAATAWSVSFTPEFKQFAYDEYMRGKSIREIFTEAGFNTGILGTSRLQNFRNDIVNRASEDIGFENERTNRGSLTEEQLLKKLRALEHRVAYLEQENDFLKKIRSAEKAFAEKTEKRN